MSLYQLLTRDPDPVKSISDIVPLLIELVDKTFSLVQGPGTISSNGFTLKTIAGSDLLFSSDATTSSVFQIITPANEQFIFTLSRANFVNSFALTVFYLEKKLPDEHVFMSLDHESDILKIDNSNTSTFNVNLRSTENDLAIDSLLALTVFN